MFYTLLKFLAWGLILALIGGCIGWALRALKCRGEVARAQASTIDAGEVERMRHRLANLEQVVAERDRLRIQLADVRHADSPGIVAAEIPPDPADEAQESASESAEVEPSDESVEVDGESPTSIVPDTASEGDASVSATVAGFASTGDGDAASSPGDDTSSGESDPDAATGGPDDADDADDSVELDLDAAEAILGTKIGLDDLTVVEGIGPKISELCRGIGVTTWRQLADTDVAALQSMLDAAGSRYTVHKPGTWPRQAALLAAGEWAEFKTLTDELDGGK